jgi:hypothetical protein
MKPSFLDLFFMSVLQLKRLYVPCLIGHAHFSFVLLSSQPGALHLTHGREQSFGPASKAPGVMLHYVRYA